MKILIACEYSGTVTKAFQDKGHKAYSCDLLPSDRNDIKHFKCDVEQLINTVDFDMIVAFPPCTHLAVSGARWFKAKQVEQKQAIDFFMNLTNADIPKIAIENPIGIMSTRYRKPDQIVQPFQFGDPYKKTTCLWLKGLPKLKPTNIVEPKIITYKDGSKFSADYGWSSNKNRSKTYQGIADAMAEQWG